MAVPYFLLTWSVDIIWSASASPLLLEPRAAAAPAPLFARARTLGPVREPLITGGLLFAPIPRLAVPPTMLLAAYLALVPGTLL